MTDTASTVQLPWRPRTLELFADNLVAMLVMGYVWRHLRPTSLLGTSVWVACIVAGSMAMGALFDRALRGPGAQRLMARTAHQPSVSGRRLMYLLGLVSLYAVVVAFLFALFWLVRPSLPPSWTDN